MRSRPSAKSKVGCPLRWKNIVLINLKHAVKIVLLKHQSRSKILAGKCCCNTSEGARSILFFFFNLQFYIISIYRAATSAGLQALP